MNRSQRQALVMVCSISCQNEMAMFSMTTNPEFGFENRQDDVIDDEGEISGDEGRSKEAVDFFEEATVSGFDR